LDPGYWHFERLSACLREMVVNFTLRSTQGGVLGTAVIYVSSSATLNPRSGSWDENLVVEPTQYTGEIKSLSVAVKVSCTSNCDAAPENPWVGNRALTDLQVASGTVSYSDIPDIGVADSTTINYTLTMFQTGTSPSPPPSVTWSNPRAIRCDTAETRSGGTSTGCALPSVSPELDLPASTYGAAAATYSWAQWNLPDHWGLYSGKPLTRALDGDARRERTCGNASSVPFVPKDLVQNDSCDEFPFASTRQGGTNGGLCAEIVPLFENGRWEIYEADPARPVTYTEPCVRGHVPNDMNSLAGLAYANLVQNQRLIDAERFYVKIPDL
jgi:hypothetical protein